MRRYLAAAVVFFIWLAFAVTPALAQSAIAGVVKDPSGGVLPGVTVEASSPVLIEKTRTAVTDQSGQFKIIDLRPGTYSVTFSLPGFGTVKREGVELPVSFTATVNTELKVGELAETITVTGKSPVVDVQGNVQQSVMSRQVLDAIPTGRNVFAQAAVVAGITTDRPDVGGSEGMQMVYMEVHGSDQDDLSFQIDGMSVNGIHNQGGTTGLYFNDGMIEEVSFQTSALPADTGAGGIRFHIVPREGGNTFSGGLFFTGANHSMQSSNLTDELKTKGLRVNNGLSKIYDVNASLGGPVKRDRLWFFTTVRRNSADRLVANTFNLDGSQAIDDNVIYSALGRVTAQLSPRNKLNFYFDKQGKSRGHRRPTGTEFVEPEATWVQRTPNGFTTQAKWTSPVTNKLLLEGGFSEMFLHWAQDYRPEVGPNDVSRVDFVRSVRSGATQYKFDQWSVRRVYMGNVSYVTGAHAFKAGLTFSEGPFREIRSIQQDIHLRFRNGVPDSVDTWNTPIEVRQRLKADSGLYAQDSWTLKRLTINAGVRWEHYNAIVQEQSAPAGRFVPERHFSEIKDVPNFDLVVPRFAVAYDLFGNGKTAIKVNASKYAKNEGMTETLLVNPVALSSDRRTWRDLNGDGNAQDNELGPPNGFRGGARGRMDPDLKRPYNWEYTAVVQHELAARFSLTAGYYRRAFRDLYGVLNTLVPESSYIPVTITNPLTNQPLTVYNQNPATRGRVDSLFTNSDLLDRTYNGVEIKLDKRFSSNSANLFGGLTIGRNEGSIREESAVLSNPNVLINHVGARGFDSTYQVKIAGYYPLPYGIGLSGVFQRNTGLPLRRTFTVTTAQIPGFTQASEQIDLQPSGEVRLPTRNLLDLRVARRFNLSGVRLEAIADIYNVLNSSAAIGQVQEVGPRLGFPSETVDGRLLRVGIQIKF